MRYLLQLLALSLLPMVSYCQYVYRVDSADIYRLSSKYRATNGYWVIQEAMSDIEYFMRKGKNCDKAMESAALLITTISDAKKESDSLYVAATQRVYKINNDVVNLKHKIMELDIESRTLKNLNKDIQKANGKLRNQLWLERSVFVGVIGVIVYAAFK